MQVDIWSDVVCPFCYIGKTRLERVARERSVQPQCVWHSFELDPDAPEVRTGSHAQHLADKYGMTPAQAEQQLDGIAAVFQREGLAFNWRQARGGNTRNAHRIIAAAQALGRGNEAEEAFFHAYFTDGRAVGELATVRAIAHEIGLGDAQIDAALASVDIEAGLREDFRAARQMGVRGVPFFVFENKVAVSGAQPDAAFVRAMERVAPAPLETIGEGGAVCDEDGCRIPDRGAS
jgi:predicted DsbA family dithiol-disulfide isomerase